MELPYDPALKEAMLKIQAIMDEYKIGASIALASKTHSEFLYHFPEWCIVQLETDFKIKIRSKLKDFESREDQLQRSEESAHFIAQMSRL